MDIWLNLDHSGSCLPAAEEPEGDQPGQSPHSSDLSSSGVRSRSRSGLRKLGEETDQRGQGWEEESDYSVGGFKRSNEVWKVSQWRPWDQV